MTFQEIKTAFGELIRFFIEMITGTQQKKYFKYIKFICISICIGLLLLAGFFLYRWYRVYREQGAQKLFAENLVAYRLAQKSNKEQDWQHAEMLFQLGYDRYMHTNLAPEFLAFKADTLIKQEKKDEAIQVLNTLLGTLSAKSLMLHVFQIKRALLLLDSDDASMQEKGLQELITLAQDKTNQYNDVALFYLGRYYSSINKMQEAKNVWQELIDSQWQERLAPSPWAQVAQQKLNQIV